MKGQEKGDLLIQVTSWAGLTVFHRINRKIQEEEQYNSV
jgi:hypothetical protein